MQSQDYRNGASGESCVETSEEHAIGSRESLWNRLSQWLFGRRLKDSDLVMGGHF